MHGERLNGVLNKEGGCYEIKIRDRDQVQDCGEAEVTLWGGNEPGQRVSRGTTL
jgi:hypothetical protein